MSFTEDNSEYHSSVNGNNFEIYSTTILPENLDFSLDEIRQQLSLLGYSQIPNDKLLAIKKDLDVIIARDETLKQTKFQSRLQGNDWFTSELNQKPNDDSCNETETISNLSSKLPPIKRKTCRKNSSYKPEDVMSQSSTPRTCGFSSEQTVNNDDNYFRKVSFPPDPVDDIFNYTGVSLDPNDMNPDQNNNKRPSSKNSSIRSHSHRSTHGWQRHDPVTRYHSYRVAWEEKKAPGESPHKQLRWAVKAALMVKEVPKPRVTKESSIRRQNYLPPGTNKRSDLRWQIRQELANPDVYFD